MNERIEVKEKIAPVTGTQNRDRRRGELAASSSCGNRGVASSAGRHTGDAAGELAIEGVKRLGDVVAAIVRRLEIGRVKSDE